MRVHYLLICLLFCILIYLLVSATDEEAGALNSSALALSRDFDYYMTTVDRTHFNPTGEAEYRLLAERFTHYPEPDHILVETPDVRIFQADQPPWHISANTGRIENDLGRQEDRVEFSDNVVISHTDNQGRELHIYTEFLTVYPDSRMLETDSDVVIESEGLRQTSTGMSADLNNERIILRSNVRGRYE